MLPAGIALLLISQCFRQESNLHLLLRREVFYPLDYGSVVLVLSVGIEPTLPAPQAGVLSIERRERRFFLSQPEDFREVFAKMRPLLLFRHMLEEKGAHLYSVLATVERDVESRRQK